MADEWKYWAFISYSHQDKRWGHRLHKALETYNVPRRLVGRISRDGTIPKRLFPIFRDDVELSASSDLGSNIYDKLKTSRYLIVICSPRSASSRWVNEEIRAFKALGREDRILCLIVDGEPNASDNPDSCMLECFPQAIRYRADTGGSLTLERIEPIAADVRKGRDSIEDATLKIIAGLIGIGFGELKQRETQRRRKGRWLGVAASIAFMIALLLPDPGPLPQMRFSAFDAYQTYFPRARTSMPAVIVAIDEASLARVGQWPWPRDIMAKLITLIAEREPAAIGMVMLFPEPDRVSPENLAKIFRARDPHLADRLSKMRSNDEIFAEVIKNNRVVVGVGGLEEPVLGNFPHTPSRQIGPSAPLRHYRGELRSLQEIDRAAAGYGLISTGLDRGVLRRVPLVAKLGDYPILSLPMECLRVASGKSHFELHSDAQGLRYVMIDLLAVPTQADGSLWVNLAPRNSALYISAADVLEGRAPEWINRKIVLIGISGLGLADFVTTSGGERMPGIEIHAQVIENIFDNSLLIRPTIMRIVEALVLALLAVVVIMAVPRIPPRHSVAVLLCCCLTVAAMGIGAYLSVQVLFDPATLIAGITALYGIMVSARLVSLFD